jgi:hypothetical protein
MKINNKEKEKKDIGRETDIRQDIKGIIRIADL